MSSKDRTGSEPIDLKKALREQINSRTWRGVQQLGIEVMADRVLITGTTTSYYLKQLALEAVKEVAQKTELPPVRLEIRVHFPKARPVAVPEYV